MGKILVLFHSASGNTAKMADLVAAGARGVPDTEVRAVAGPVEPWEKSR